MLKLINSLIDLFSNNFKTIILDIFLSILVCLMLKSSHTSDLSLMVYKITKNYPPFYQVKSMTTLFYQVSLFIQKLIRFFFIFLKHQAAKHNF
jgi:hypothetical protein